MMRLGLLKENEELTPEEGFVLCDTNGIEKVRLIALIGRGGTALAYRGIREKNGRTSSCVVKEYFPSDAYEDGIYIRDHVGDPIQIAPEYRDQALKIQKETVEHELEMSQKIYFNVGEDTSNNPYVYQSELFCTMGDSSYIVIDTDEGETLYSKMQRKLSPKESLRFIRQLAVIVDHLSRKGILHADIKPENIYVRGSGANMSLCLLDFGSVVPLKDYQKDVSKLSVSEVFETADQIIQNTTLGSTTKEYGSLSLLSIRTHKRLYKTSDPSFERAEALIETVNQLSVKDDLYSVVRITEELLEHADMEEEQRESIREVLEEMQMKNQGTGYQSVEELQEDIEVLETILHNGAHPAVLIKNLAKSAVFCLPDDFEEELLCDVE